ncbi:MAG: hypothetical protein GWN85_25145, partial [Gemmatimonadetes bacterium]|nr:hypothetical protein [Gemmatimonadota bacterium]NIW35722.1 hypothetical protein [Gemmatimonadota bacterium]
MAKTKKAGATRSRAKTKKRGSAAKKGKAATKSKAAEGELTVRAVQDAVDGARDWLSERRDYYGYLSRRDSGRGAPELAGHLRGDLRAKQGPDGSWNEADLAASAESLWRLLDLGLPSDSPAVGRALDWLYGRRD